ncbi:MAG: hypothetical protein RBT11_04085 [Desulfobacterales bacterium]|jgi:hypothetical protein|nr:hypothetical protein [Desulfobacterales bacterium]
MKLPKTGDMITTEKALEICKFYGMENLVQRITLHFDAYKPWVFDGCSMLPDKMVAAMTGISTLTEICLRHDLRYAYGEPGNREERLRADYMLGLDLLDGGANAIVSKAFFDGVRLGGGESGYSFSWAFARK